MSAVATTAGTMTAAAFGIGAANALGTAFLSPIDIEGCASKDHQNNGHNNNIDHSLFLSAESILCFQLLVGIDAQVNHNGHHYNHSDQTTCKAGTKSTGGDKCTDLVDQEA